MNKYKNIIAILFLSVLVTNCASVGNESLVGQKPEQVNSAIVKGKTTMSEIKGIYGDPFETSFTAKGTLIYKYQYDDTSAMNAKTVASVLFTYGLAGLYPHEPIESSVCHGSSRIDSAFPLS